MDVDTHETAQLIASDKVEGTAVYSPDGEKLGHVERFMVDKVSGRAEYAVLAFGGLFGIGHRHYPLPWQALAYDTAKGGYVVSVSREQLEGAPSYEQDEPSYDRAYGERVYGHYGLTYM
ncbi:PRC-barrel domain-containing protein [Sphingomonas sp. CJ99]